MGIPVEFLPHEVSESMTHSSFALAQKLAEQVLAGEISIFEVTDDEMRLLQNWSPDGKVELRQDAA